jgi:hypothetical protein
MSICTQKYRKFKIYMFWLIIFVSLYLL